MKCLFVSSFLISLMWWMSSSDSLDEWSDSFASSLDSFSTVRLLLKILFACFRAISFRLFCIFCSLPVHLVPVSFSRFSNDTMSMLRSRLQNCWNLFIHCLRVNTGFQSAAFASSLGTMFLSAIVELMI